ncbi:coth-domain-containing protein [Piromyces finnis]|uniref:Coth-domain-containing protein n=1 Tax=Piromyces finnis TaxID=1754191 RepID=A0A1Y1VEW1_9FUNG|nr:coth-domain-containing protein [Piromyces finnis]|eukprot:ORX54338.1 coth-domain-containing protein [Piromyces finnis]
MKKSTILSVVLAVVGKTMADCWSSALGYQCCKGCSVISEDADGKWGFEDKHWCGIVDDVCKEIKESCWSLPDYPCCKTTSLVVSSDAEGDWGYEDNQWCGIVKDAVNNDCWSLPHYQCCKGNVVVQSDSNGDWGYEDGQWCGIIKKTEGGNENTQNGEKPNVSINADAVPPQFSMESGFYENVEGLNLTLNSEGTILYTLDSTDPTTSSTAKVYEGPIKMYDRSIDENVISKCEHIDKSPISITLQTNYKASPVLADKATVIRAVTKFEDGSYSPVVTKTFLVMNSEQLKFYSEIPIVSLVTEPSNLFDKDTGIYVTGQQYIDWMNGPDYNPAKSEWDSDNIANFYSKGKEWERPASFTLFEDGKEVKSQNVGIRIKGASTRNSQVKSFNIYARKEYGESKFEYEIIKGNKNINDGKNITKYDSFSLRACAWFDKMRESVVQRGLKESPILATFDNNKSLVFIDGEFWGLYELIERASANYIKSNYDIPKDNVALIKNDELEEGTDADLKDFQDLVKFCKNNDLTKEQNYNYVAKVMDLDSLIYNYATGLYLGVWDWPNRNYLVYRNNGEPIEGNPYADGKWRWGFFDFDYSTGLTYDSFGGVKGYAHDSFRKFQSKKNEFPTPIFSRLMKNKKFYKRFAEVMEIMAEEVFNPEKMKKIVEEQKAKYLKYIVKTDWRWFNGTPKMSFESFSESQGEYFTGGWDDMTEFFENRPKYAYDLMVKNYGAVDKE